jgi:hypothetical protein
MNIALLLKNDQRGPQSQADSLATEIFEDKVYHIDSLAVESWKDKKTTQISFSKPAILFLFSKQSCMTCVERVVDLLTKNKIGEFETFIIATDVESSSDRMRYDAVFLRSLPFYSLRSLQIKTSPKLQLPTIVIVDAERRIVMASRILPIPTGGETLFWSRLGFLYSILNVKKGTK